MTTVANPAPTRLAALDGFRGVAVLLVLIAHYVGGSLQLEGPLSLPLEDLGDLGVEMFFVLSGFLITGILVREQTRSGRISFRGFYVRRTLRIWPAFYTLIAAVAVLGALHVLHITVWEDIAAGLFIWNYAPGATDWWLAHTWSLAIEEQFYLVWPLLLSLLRPRRAIWFCVAGFAVVPVLRVGTYLMTRTEAERELIGHMSHVRADSLLIGCLAALLVATRPALWERWQGFVTRWRLAWIAAPVLLLSQELTRLVGGTWRLTAGFTLENLAIAALLTAALAQSSRLGTALSWKPLAFVGVISFSLYLWQQLILTKLNTTVLAAPWLSPAVVAVIALVSYFGIERPFLRLKERHHQSRGKTPVEASIDPAV